METTIEKQAYRVDEFCHAYGIGRSKFYEEVGQGRIKVFKLGRLTLIAKEEAQRWLDLCQTESPSRLIAGGAR